MKEVKGDEWYKEFGFNKVDLTDIITVYDKK
jgi:hypothetical protein